MLSVLLRRLRLLCFCSMALVMLFTVGVSADSSSFSLIPYTSSVPSSSDVQSQGLRFGSESYQICLSSVDYSTCFFYRNNQQSGYLYNMVFISFDQFTLYTLFGNGTLREMVSFPESDYYYVHMSNISYSSSDYVPTFSSYSEGVSAAKEYLIQASTPPAPQPLFVAGTYDNNPLSIKQGFNNVLLSSSYNLYDSEFTPIYNNNNFVSSRLVSISPQNYYAQYVCFETMNYSSSQYKSLSISGTFDFYFQTSSILDNNLNQLNFIYPSSSFLAVNGEPVYINVSSNGEGSYSYSGVIDLTEDVVSIGVISTFDNSTSVLGVSEFSAGFYASNDLVITPNLIVTQTPNNNATIGDIQVDLSDVQSGINTEIQKQNNIIQMLMSLSQTIGDAFGKAFVPDAQVVQDYNSLFSGLLEDKLGFVWQSGEYVVSFATDVQSVIVSGVSPESLSFGPVELPLGSITYTIIPQTSIDFDNDLMDILLPALNLIVSFICVLAFINSCRDMVIAIVSGSSYMEYLSRKKGSEES